MSKYLDMLGEPGKAIDMKVQSSEDGRSCESTKSSTGSRGCPVMMSTIVEERIKLFDDLRLKSRGVCEDRNEVQVQLGRYDGIQSTSMEKKECLPRDEIQCVQKNVPKMNTEVMTVNDTKVHAVLSTGILEGGAMFGLSEHCKRVNQVQGDHTILKSAKGDSSIWKSNFACEAKTMGASKYLFESKLMTYSAGISTGPTSDQGLLETFRPRGLDQPGDRGIGTWGETGTADRKNPQNQKYFATEEDLPDF